MIIKYEHFCGKKELVLNEYENIQIVGIGTFLAAFGQVYLAQARIARILLED
jgi:hypothetical protein